MKKDNIKKIHQHFLPRTDAGRVLWTGNFKENIRVVGPKIKMAPTEVTRLEDCAVRYIDCVNLVEIRRQALEEAVAEKEYSRKTDLQALLKAGSFIKKSPDYQESYGGVLGIIGSSVEMDTDDLQPVLKARVFQGRVQISFNLQAMTSISIYSRIKGTMGWQKLGNDYASPFEDRRPLAVEHQPEIREYQAFYFDGREDVGQPSDIVSAVFAG